MCGVVQWEPTLENYLQFLVESKVMYEALEVIVAEAKHESCASPPLPTHLPVWSPTMVKIESCREQTNLQNGLS